MFWTRHVSHSHVPAGVVNSAPKPVGAGVVVVLSGREEEEEVAGGLLSDGVEEDEGEESVLGCGD